jgi:uncharacterized lipoprotein YbaY
VTGTVTYLQRTALPDGAQVPIPYTVPYDVEAIDERNTYSMSARIEDGAGELLFISDTAVPVITNGNPAEDVEIVIVPVGSPQGAWVRSQQVSRALTQPRSTIRPTMCHGCWS